METWKKTGNIIGIVFAWVFSIILVFMLIVAPVALSALSLLNTDTILDALTGTLTQSIAPKDDETAADYSVTKLSETSDNASADAAEDIGKDVLSQFLGQDVSQEVLEQILSSNAAKELIDAYTSDVANAFSGSGKDAKFNAELVKKIVNENIDEIVQIAQEIAPEGTQIDVEELKSQITGVVEEKAEEIVKALPKPEEIKDQLMQQTPEIETAFQILANVGTIKAIIVAVIVVISGLIFLCRLPGFRGFRWLATDLFIGSGFGLLTCAGLSVARSAVVAMIPSQEMVGDLVGSFLSKFATGLWIRTGVMVASAVVLLVAYILIKKYLAQKAAAKELPAAEETSEIAAEDTETAEEVIAVAAETVEAE